jgi:serine/threonine protein kinase
MLDNQFIIRKCLGQGGSSRVFNAEHPTTEEFFAVKIIRKDKGINPKKAGFILQQEHDRMQLLQEHPNILKSFETVPEGTFVTDT